MPVSGNAVGESRCVFDNMGARLDGDIFRRDGATFSLNGDEVVCKTPVRERFNGLELLESRASLLPVGDVLLDVEVSLMVGPVSNTSLFASAMARDTFGGASGFQPSLAPNTPHGDESGLILCPFGLHDPFSRRNMGLDLFSGVLDISTFFLVAVAD